MAKIKKKNKTGQSKAASMGLEGFVDGTNLGVSELAEEKEADMFGLVSDFAARMRKQVASAQGFIAPGTEVHGGKCPKLVGPDEQD